MANPLEAPHYLLTAGGGIAVPTLAVGIYQGHYPAALEEARRIVTVLHKAGYINFWLTAQDGEMLGRFSVEQTEPVATFNPGARQGRAHG